MLEGLWNIFKTKRSKSPYSASSTSAGQVPNMQVSDFVLLMLGDVMLGRLVNDSFIGYPDQIRNVWGDTLDLLIGGGRLLGKKQKIEGQEGEVLQNGLVKQIVVGNLECAVTDNEEKYPKTFNYKLSPSNIEALKQAQFQYVSLANNHSLDYCDAGLIETVNVLKENEIGFSGAGANLSEAMKPAFVNIDSQNKTCNIAFFSYSDHYDYWAAKPEKAGINYINPSKFDVYSIKTQFEEARSQNGADMIAVFIHWGPNWRWEPSKDIQKLGYAFIDQGANLVFGHSSHHIQGIEIYKGHPIIYGAGGFVDDYAVDDNFRNDLGFIYRLGFKNLRPHCLHLTPTCIRHNWMPRGSRPPYLSNVQLAKGSDQKWLLNKMRELCQKFETDVQLDSAGTGLFINFEDADLTSNVENAQTENVQ